MRGKIVDMFGQRTERYWVTSSYVYILYIYFVPYNCRNTFSMVANFQNNEVICKWSLIIAFCCYYFVFTQKIDENLVC